MNAQELALVKAMLHDLVDKDLPMLIAAEEAKLPAAYQALVGVVVNAAMPTVLAYLDSKIDAIGAAPAAPVA